MGHFRFRKSIKIAPGVKLNFNKKSSSITFGGKGAHYTVNSNGKRTTSVGIPGTGLSYVDTQTKSNKPVFKSMKNEPFQNNSTINYTAAPEINHKFSTPPPIIPIKQKPPIYNRNWFIILMLFFATPIGIFLMWYCRELKTFIKVIISIFFIFYFMIYCEIIALIVV